MSPGASLCLCVNGCIYGTDRKCACVLHMFTFLVRQRAVLANGGPQPEKQTGRGPRRESPGAQGRAGTLCPSLCLGQHQRQLRAPHRSVAIEVAGTPRCKITREKWCLRSGFKRRWTEKGASSFFWDSAHFFFCSHLRSLSLISRKKYSNKEEKSTSQERFPPLIHNAIWGRAECDSFLIEKN